METRQWQLLNYFHIMAPILLLLFPSFWATFYQSDAAQHIAYTNYLFAAEQAPPPNMENYPPLMHFAIYVLALGQPALMVFAFGLLVVAVLAGFRLAFYWLLWWLPEARKLLVMALIFECPAVAASILGRASALPGIFKLFIFYEAAAQPRFIWSLEMLTAKVGLLPSYAAMALGLVALSYPTWLVPLAILTRLISHSGQVLFFAVCLIGFAKTRRIDYVIWPALLFFPLNPLRISIGVFNDMAGDLRLLITAIWAATVFFCFKENLQSR